MAGYKRQLEILRNTIYTFKTYYVVRNIQSVPRVVFCFCISFFFRMLFICCFCDTLLHVLGEISCVSLQLPDENGVPGWWTWCNRQSPVIRSIWYYMVVIVCRSYTGLIWLNVALLYFYTILSAVFSNPRLC